MALVLVFGLVWIIVSSLLVSSFVLCGTTTLVLCGTTTFALCGTTTIVLYGTHHPLWLPFYLIGWFGLWSGFGLSPGDNLGFLYSHSGSMYDNLILGIHTTSNWF
jgi:hypothetical protein